MMEHETLLTQQEVEASLKILASKGMAYYDEDNEVVLVVNMFKYQGRKGHVHESCIAHDPQA
jgi:hypothetical protein